MIKKLSQCIGEYKKPSILAPVFVTGEVILEVMIPFVMGKIIDFGIRKSDMRYTLAASGILILLVVLSMFCGAMSGRYAAIASSGFAKNLREKMFWSIQDFSFTNIDRFSAASLVTRLTTDVTNLQNSYQMIIRVAVRCPVMLAFSLAMAFYVNHGISLVFLAVVPILAIGLYVIIKNAHPIFERVFRTYDKLNRVVRENLHGIRVVKSFVREDFEEKKFESVSEDIYRSFSRAEKILAFNSPLMQFSMYSCMLLISWFGAHAIVGGSMTDGDLISLVTYAMQILMSLMGFSMVFVMITISRASAERIVEVLDEKSDLTDGAEGIGELADGSVSFENVSFSYSGSMDNLCLRNISLDIKSGETIGIIGGTGSAKTTLVQLIPRLYDVTDGKLTVGGLDVREYSLRALRDSVAMVLQKNQLFSGTIKENLRWGNENASDDEMIHACTLAQADEFIRSFPDGYDTYIEQGGANVSGGQRQRLCIARALLKNPKILILDDSTSAVDTKTDRLIRRAFAEEIPDTTKIIIAQRVASVENADRIIVLDDGRVDAFGTHEELLKSNAIYREVYFSQQKGGESDEC